MRHAYDQITSAAQSRDELMKGFLESSERRFRDEAQMHRLWYGPALAVSV